MPWSFCPWEERSQSVLGMVVMRKISPPAKNQVIIQSLYQQNYHLCVSFNIKQHILESLELVTSHFKRFILFEVESLNTGSVLPFTIHFGI